MQTYIKFIARATLVLKHINEGSNGAELAVYRADVTTGAYDDEIAGAVEFEANNTADNLVELTIHDMPPDTDDVALLLETCSQRLGGISRAMVWQSIGINKNRGRDLLARNAGAVDWPIWKTLRDAALAGK